MDQEALKEALEDRQRKLKTVEVIQQSDDEFREFLRRALDEHNHDLTLERLAKSLREDIEALERGSERD